MSEFGDEFGGYDHLNLVAVIEPVRSFNWRPLLSKVGDALGGYDRVKLEAIIERDCMSVWRQSMYSAPGTEIVFIS